ncbi:FAD-binding oxidoreductase [Rubinisphaera margarita]|uniref:FAD-binding oxidoreductase n=1 Tax=Rubinisphaera margarita TaxID=2909586 RepID=UPI001EE79829|nr:FAD-binding protein [Rubinisphaera margarita]MCG6154804.1 FAD-binding protein [Rubinisphaera margarita]
MFSPTSIEDLQQWWKNRSAEQGPIRWMQSWPEAATEPELSLRDLRNVIDYPHRDMTITVQTGMTIAELQRILAEHEQRLPLDVPVPESTTVADLICRNWFGSLVCGHGTPRDWLLGVTAIDGRGRVSHSGGRVVKNVAGYDVPKLLIGSRGQLAIPLEASFKVLPVAEASQTLRIEVDSFQQQQNVWTALRDLPFDPVVFDARLQNHSMIVSVEGPAGVCSQLLEQIEAAARTTGAMMGIAAEDASTDSWRTVERSLQELSGPAVVIQIGGRASQTIPLLEVAAEFGLDAVGHASRGAVVAFGSANALEGREAALYRKLRSLQANAEVLTGSVELKSQLDAVQAAASDWPIRRELKRVFDPSGLLEPLTASAAAV